MNIDINNEEYEEILSDLQMNRQKGQIARDQRAWGKSWTQEDKDRMAIRVEFLDTLLDKFYKAKEENNG